MDAFTASPYRRTQALEKPTLTLQPREKVQQLHLGWTSSLAKLKAHPHLWVRHVHTKGKSPSRRGHQVYWELAARVKTLIDSSGLPSFSSYNISNQSNDDHECKV